MKTLVMLAFALGCFTFSAALDGNPQPPHTGVPPKQLIGDTTPKKATPPARIKDKTATSRITARSSSNCKTMTASRSQPARLARRRAALACARGTVSAWRGSFLPARASWSASRFTRSRTRARRSMANGAACTEQRLRARRKRSGSRRLRRTRFDHQGPADSALRAR